MYSHRMVKFHLGAKTHGLGLVRTSSLSPRVNAVPSVEFHYPTLVIINDSINLILYLFVPEMNFEAIHYL